MTSQSLITPWLGRYTAEMARADRVRLALLRSRSGTPASYYLPDHPREMLFQEDFRSVVWESR
jgi:hypothetical protein